MLQKIKNYFRTVSWLKYLCLICVPYDLVVGLYLMNECVFQLNPILLLMILLMQSLAFIYTFDLRLIVEYLPEISLNRKFFIIPFLIIFSIIYYPLCFSVFKEGGHLTKYGYCVPKNISDREIRDMFFISKRF